jgi:hypothetical protein
MNAEPIGKKTVVTVAILVGACIAFVGTTSTAAVVLTAAMVGSSTSGESAPAAKTPAPAPSARVAGKGG